MSSKSIPDMQHLRVTLGCTSTDARFRKIHTAYDLPKLSLVVPTVVIGLSLL